MDIHYEEELSSKLLKAWQDGNFEKTEMLATILSNRMYDDENVAKYHFQAIKGVANGVLPVSAAHMILHQCYRRGWSVAADQSMALHHLELAISCGSENARWFLGCYLLNKDVLSSVIPHDPARAMDIFRDLANNAEDITIKKLSQRSAASYIATNLKYHEVSPEDMQLVERYALDKREIIGLDFLYLALFFADGVTGKDYAGPSYRKSRELLIAGSRSHSVKAQDACLAQLDAWGLIPLQEASHTPTNKPIEAVKAVGIFSGIVLTTLLWSFVGVFLLSVVAVIDAAVIPVIVILFIVGLVIVVLRGSS